jgi:sugar-specific transcriptional regulator TrmB
LGEEEFVLNAFRNLGLTDKETQVYVYLLKKGPAKGGEISKSLNIHKSQIYSLLKSLQSKGVAKSTIESPARFQALPIEDVLYNNITSKMQEVRILEETKDILIKQLKNTAMRHQQKAIETLMITEGHRRIISKIFQMVEQTREEILILICGFTFSRPVQLELNRKIIEKVKTGKTRLRVLLSSKENNEEIQNIIRKAKKANSQNFSVRCLNLSNGFQACFFLKDQEEVLFFLSLSCSGEKDVCLVTNSNAIINFLRVIFDDFWDTGITLFQAIDST